jgi:Yip1-like protein
MADEAASDIWVNSWFTIWYEPRATIRRIVDTDAHRFVVGIAFVSGAMAAIYSQVAVSTASVSSLPHLPRFGTIGLAVGTIISGVLSIISLYGLAALYRWSGHILGGTATRVEMRSALAWAEVPGLYLGLANIVAALIGFDAPGAPSAWSGSQVVDSIAGIWIFVISLKCIGEVHRFSAWRALGAIILGFLAMVAVVVGIVGTIWLAVVIARSML